MQLTLGMLWSSAEPVAQIVIMCLVGAVLARVVSASARLGTFCTACMRRISHNHLPLQGILNQKARQHLSQLVFYLFVPALSFTKLGASVDLRQISRWWPLPVNTALR